MTDAPRSRQQRRRDTGFNPRALSTSYRWYRVRPQRVQAWREENELAGRDLMRDGRWLA